MQNKQTSLTQEYDDDSSDDVPEDESTHYYGTKQTINIFLGKQVDENRIQNAYIEMSDMNSAQQKMNFAQQQEMNEQYFLYSDGGKNRQDGQKEKINVDKLFLKSASNLKNHMNYNFNKTASQEQDIPIREDFKKISHSFYNKCNEYQQHSERLIFHQEHYGGLKSFQFERDVENSKKITHQLQKDESSQSQSNLDNGHQLLRNYSYKTPIGQEININLKQKYDVKKVQQEIQQKFKGEELRVSQNKMTNPNDGQEMDLNIKSIYNFQEETGQDRLPSDFTKELMHSFNNFQDFVENLETDDQGEYILGAWEEKAFGQLVSKRDKLLKEDILERGVMAQVPSQFYRQKGTGGTRQGVEQLNRDLCLIFNDPQNQVLNDIEDGHIDSEDLQFRDITSFLADRIQPDQLLYNPITSALEQNVNLNYIQQQFESFKPSGKEIKEEKIQKFKPTKATTQESYVQTDNDNFRKPKTQGIEQNQEQVLKQKEHYSFFQKIQKEVNQIKIHKNKYQSDNSYTQLLSSHIVEKLNLLWRQVKESEVEFEKYDTIQQSIEVIYEYVYNLKGHHTSEGNSKAEVLLWIMEQYKQICDDMIQSKSTQGLFIPNSHHINNQKENKGIQISNKQKPLAKNSSSNRINIQHLTPKPQVITSKQQVSQKTVFDPQSRISSIQTLKQVKPMWKTSQVFKNTQDKSEYIKPSNTPRNLSVSTINPRAISQVPFVRNNLLEEYQYDKQYGPFKPISLKMKELDSKKQKKLPINKNKISKSFL